jgi:hypothetical protein
VGACYLGPVRSNDEVLSVELDTDRIHIGLAIRFDRSKSGNGLRFQIGLLLAREHPEHSGGPWSSSCR